MKDEELIGLIYNKSEKMKWEDTVSKFCLQSRFSNNTILIKQIDLERYRLTITDSAGDIIKIFNNYQSTLIKIFTVAIECTNNGNIKKLIHELEML